MSEIRFITSSDEHLSDINPGFRKDAYRDAILSKLEWQGELASKMNSNAVLRGGDLFHIKAANKTTMSTLAATAGIHYRYPCPTYSVSGNHDMSQNDPSSIPRQPLGVLFESGAMRRLEDERFESGSMRVRVVGVEYTTDLYDEGLRDLVKKKNDEDTYTIAIVHALAAFAPEEKIQSFFNEKIFDYRDLVFDGCPDVYVFGHYHKDQGIREHLGVKFVNLGAVSRGALVFENLDRIPKVSSIVLNSQGISIEEHEIPSGDASAIFDIDRKKQIEKEKRSMDSFLRTLAQTNHIGMNDVKSKLELIKNNKEYSEDLRNLLVETIENAESGVLDDE